jgi:probable HAF family extracellular repeat protein
MRCTKAVFVTLCLALSLEARVQAGYNFTTLTPPDSDGSSAAYGINDQGDVVGLYYTPSSNRNYTGFVLSNGVYTTISYSPSSYIATTVSGISNAGSMVGFYQPPFFGPFSFEVIGGKIIDLPVPVPGSLSTQASGINSLGQVVGTYDGPGYYPCHGFLLNGSTYTTIDYPSVGGGDTMVGGINDKGDIVYVYISYMIYCGLVLSGGRYTTFSFSDSFETYVTGINQSGQIVGYYADNTAGNDHGFLYQDGRFTAIDYPGALGTAVRGINDRGEIVGSYYGADGTLYAFTAAPAVPEPVSAILLASGLGIVFTAASLARGRLSGGRRCEVRSGLVTLIEEDHLRFFPRSNRVRRRCRPRRTFPLAHDAGDVLEVRSLLSSAAVI